MDGDGPSLWCLLFLLAADALAVGEFVVLLAFEGTCLADDAVLRVVQLFIGGTGPLMVTQADLCEGIVGVQAFLATLAGVSFQGLAVCRRYVVIEF